MYVERSRIRRVSTSRLRFGRDRICRKPPLRVTLADFLEWPGDGTAKRYQLVDGEVRAMSPASDVHGLIQSTLAYLVTRHLIDTGSPCRGRSEGAVNPHVRSTLNLRVPDYVVSCSRAGLGRS